MFMRHDTTGEIAARRELPSLVQILSTSRRTTGLKVDRSITRKTASGCNGSVSAGRARDFTAVELTPKLSDRIAVVRGRQLPTHC